jgi:tetratricopeptide (TPR) repeat protein
VALTRSLQPAPRGRSSALRGLALALCASLPLTPLPAAAAAAPVVAAIGVARTSQPDADGTDPLTESKGLYQDGKSKYDLFDYDGAIDAWSKAYAVVPESEDARPIRNALVFNLAVAQRKAFDLDGDVTRLKKAKLLIERYLKEYQQLYGIDPNTAEETAESRAKLAEIEALLAEREAKPEPVPPPGPTTEPEPTPEPGPTAPVVDEAAVKKARTLLIAGGVVAGLGLVTGAVVGGLGAAQGQAAEDEIIDNPLQLGTTRATRIADGRNANTLAIAGAAAGGALLVVGVIVLGVGAAKLKRAKAGDAQARKLHLAPVATAHAGGSYGGLSFGGRF